MKKIISLFISSALFLALLCSCGKTEFEITFLNTGKSDAAVIYLDGTIIVSDAADADDYAAISDCVKKYGTGKIDYLVLSHYDKDHIGAAAELVKNNHVGHVIGSNYGETSEEYAAFVTAVTDTGTDYNKITQAYSFKTDRGSVTIEPPIDFFDKNVENNNSLFMTVTHRGYSFLFTGDAQKERMEEFQPFTREEYDLVKLPHHGGFDKGLRHFMNNSKIAAYVVCTDAAESVDAELTKKLTNDETPVYYTYNGDIIVTTDKNGLVVKQGDAVYTPQNEEEDKKSNVTMPWDKEEQAPTEQAPTETTPPEQNSGEEQTENAGN